VNNALRYSALVVIVVLVASCGRSGPTSPTATRVAAVPPLEIPPAATTFPPLSGPSRTFVFDRELSNRVSDYTTKSRIVLYDNGAFVLQFTSLSGEYRGGYTNTNGVIAFEWEGWSSAGPWGATGIVNGDSLTVQYNLIMRLSDFDDAVYVRTP
jgi:predicted small lipoprotein YifL